ncbi:MAG: hypothetical protein ACLFVR_12215 [Thiohalospira sp.]
MKKLLLITFCLLLFKASFSLEPLSVKDKTGSLSQVDANTELILNTNYQQFRTQILSLETKQPHDFSNIRRRGKDDYLMLYVAGGIAVATAALILTNNPDNFVTNNASDVNTGIALGGTFACGLIVTKFIIDRNR